MMKWTMFNLDSAKKRILFPLVISVLYIIITLLLSIVGPIEYFNGVYKKDIVVIYVGCIIVFMVTGYLFGLRIKNSYSQNVNTKNVKNKLLRLIRLSQDIALVSITMEIFYLMAEGSLNIGVGNVGAVYLSVDRSGGANANFIMIFRFLTDYFRMASVSWGFYYYKDINKFSRLKIMLCVLGIFVINFFGYGTQKGIGYLFIYLIVALVANRFREGARVKKNIVLIIIILGIVIFFLFGFMQYKRYQLLGINAQNFHLRSTGEFGYNTNHIIFKVFGDDMGFGLATILGPYLSMGYYGLSLCFQLPFEWTYGVGNSYAIMKLLEKIGITGILERTYVMRMQATFGRNAMATWNTIFPWLASDYTWIGTLFVFFIIGVFMAFTWKDVLLHKNPFSFLFFTMLLILILFLPANNQIVHGYDNLITFIFVVLGWLFLRKRYMYE